MRVPRYMLITSLKRSFTHAIRENIMDPRNYQGAIDALNKLQTNANYIKNATNEPKCKTNLPAVRTFLKRSGLSEADLDKLSVVHVTGTNGKGSTCAYTDNILRYHGYTTGFFSSPHLLDVRERIRLNGIPISKAEFAQYFWKIYDLLSSQKEHDGDMPLYFRFLTILAFHIFLDHKVDVAIFEVGIGGEYDCTNIIRRTAVAGITPLDMDHMPLLGNTLESIAWNKSGIMKENCAAFTTKQSPSALKIFQDRSIEKKCTLQVVDDDLYGENNSNIPIHVRKTNASLALALTEAYMNRDSNNNYKKFDIELAKKAIQETYWPGRYEIKHYQGLTFYLDGAHTLASSIVCRDWYLSQIKDRKNKRALIFNLTGSRDPQIFFTELRKCDFQSVIFIPNVGSTNDRSDTSDFILSEDAQSVKCKEFKTVWSKMEDSLKRNAENVEVLPSFSKALEFLQKSGEYDILVTGSIHLVGAALSVLDPTLGDTADFKLPEDKQFQRCQEYRHMWMKTETSMNNNLSVEVFPAFLEAMEYLHESGPHDTLVTGSIHLIGAALSVLDPTLSGTLK